MNKRRKKMALAVVVLGAGAMIADRAMFGTVEPAPASAAPPKSGSVSPARPTKTAAAGPESLVIPELVFPKSIPQAASLDDVRDWFAPPVLAAAGDGNASPPPVNGEAEPRPVSPGAKFEERFRLDAVVVIGTARLAVVGGRWMRVGDALEPNGGRLLEVRDQSAVFDVRGEKKTLRVFQSVLAPGN